MIPAELVQSVPLTLVWYSRGSQGTGAKPTNGQVITSPIIGTIAWQTGEWMNPAGGASVAQDLFGTSSTQLQRFTGLFYADVFVYQDVDALLELQERNLLRLLDATGAADQMKTVQTRVVRASQPYRERFQLMNAEARFRYTNGAGNTTVHDFSILLRTA